MIWILSGWESDGCLAEVTVQQLSCAILGEEPQGARDGSIPSRNGHKEQQQHLPLLRDLPLPLPCASPTLALSNSAVEKQT